MLCGVCAIHCAGASSDPGTDALVRVDGAQFVPGPMPVGDETGPKIESIQTLITTVIPGTDRGTSLSGTVDENATGVAIGMPGDRGYWVVPPAPPHFEAPTSYAFDVDLAFSSDLPPGSFQIAARAAARGGHFGPLSSVTLTAASSSVATGQLVITLRWDTNADLDLHVDDPGGVEIWSHDVSTLEPSGGNPMNPNAVYSNGYLDADSNAQCVIDGRREENVIYPMKPLAGHYTARVDAFSMCGQSAAHWTVEARRKGQVFATASGTSIEDDTREPHQIGSGVTALEFDQP